MSRYPVLPLHDFAAFAVGQQEYYPNQNDFPPFQEQQHVVEQNASPSPPPPPPAPAPSKKKPTRKERKALQEDMDAAVRVLDRMTQAMDKSKNGDLPRKYDALMHRVLEFQSSHEQALERKWAQYAVEREKEKKRLAREEARCYMESIRLEIKRRYDLVASLNKSQRRKKVPVGTMAFICDQVRQDMNVPPHIKIDVKNIHKPRRERPGTYKKRRAAVPTQQEAAVSSKKLKALHST